MFECQVCQAKFKTVQELGGHVANAHPKEPKATAGGETASTVSPGSEQPPPAPAPAEKTETKPPAGETPAATPQLPAPVAEPSEADQIRSYRKQGYTFRQLTAELGFKPSTVREVIARGLTPEGGPQDDKSTLPMVVRNGKGEMIAPEAVYWHLVADDGIDGERDFKALMKWAACIEMVHRMTQIRKGDSEALAEAVKPMLEMMEKSRQELDAAAARARESTMQVAEVAAASAAARATAHIDQRLDELKPQKPEKADIATVHDPMKGLMARTMETIMNQLTGMLTGSQVSPTPGLVDKRVDGGK